MERELAASQVTDGVSNLAADLEMLSTLEKEIQNEMIKCLTNSEAAEFAEPTRSNSAIREHASVFTSETARQTEDRVSNLQAILEQTKFQILQALRL